MEILPNFTPRVQQSIKIAKRLAVDLEHEFIEPLHLLYGVSKIQHSIFQLMNISGELSSMNIDQILNLKSESKSFSIDKLTYSKSFKKILRESVVLAEAYIHDYVGIEHVLVCLFRDRDVSNFLDSFGINSKELAKNILTILEGEVIHKYDDVKKFLKAKEVHLNPKNAPIPTETKTVKNNPEFLINFNDLAASGAFDKVVCRSSDIQSLTEILSRRQKNNPILLGEAGVGKTALIEALSQQIVQKKVPNDLSSKTIFSLNLNHLISGTKYRGQFEERFKKLLDKYFVGTNNILFIDEIHTLIGAGGAEGGLDAANILKPLLSRRDISCIGATTMSEFKKSIERDPALSRRFQPLYVNEPSPEDCFKILECLTPEYESFHKVLYRKNSLKKAVDLSIRFLNDRFLPDKAIDLIDEAGAKAKVKFYRKPENLINLESKLENLIDEDFQESCSKKKGVIGEKIDNLFIEYQNLLDSWQKDIAKQKIHINAQDIERLVSEKTGLPISSISLSLDEKVLNLKSKLKKEIVGQDEALDSIYRALVRSTCGLSNPAKPIGCFLLTGKTGTGKTLTAKIISKIIYGGENNLIRLDMGEFSEAASVSKITGSSPGYVGYDEGSKFIDSVRRNPYSVILFDEVEKAHPEVFKSLLSILDEGKIFDNFGRQADFSNCLIILTSNIGSEIMSSSSGSHIGFQNHDAKLDIVRDKVIDKAKSFFSPEFINRLDEIIFFSDFSNEDYKRIINQHLTNLNKKMAKNNFKVKIFLENSLVNFFLDELSNISLGARPIERLFQSHIETPVAESILAKKIKSKSNIHFRYENGEVNFSS